jgi:error-prone DNA polymerase
MLHARSAFSFHQSASSPEEMVRQAAKLGLSHLAITDRDGFYGSARAHQEAKSQGIKAIVGMELTLEAMDADLAPESVPPRPSTIPLLIQTREGYQNLCHLITVAKLRSTKKTGSRVSYDELAAHSQGLYCLTGDEDSPIYQALAADDRPTALRHAEALRRIFGPDHLAVELQRHRTRGESRINQALIHLAQHLGLPLLATDGALYHHPERRPLHDAFTCLRHHTHLDAAGKLLAPNSQRQLRSRRELAELFPDLPATLRQTDRIIESIEYGLENLGYRFPDYPVPAGHDMASFLREITYTGAATRYPLPLRAEVKQQLDHELRLIGKLGFPGYFLIIWDLMKWAKTERGILCQGRGSAANSAVCYSLGITNVDPVGCGLLFERFLSEGRESWPDIDIDFPSGTQRESVIQEVYRRYAPYGAAMTANVITYRGRSTIREMGKTLNLPEDILARFTDLYPHGDFPSTLEFQAQLKQAGLPEKHPRLQALVTLYQSAYGLPRHLGQHSGGMIICSDGLDKVVPLEPATMPGRTVVQWDKDDCEDLGIIKVDLLGLGMLAAMEESVVLCAQRGRPVDLAKIPKDDPATYDLMCAADTIGTFQIESRAQQATLPRMKPRCFYDVVIEVAIIRPGPIVGKMVHPYLDRRAGRAPVDYIDRRLKNTLQRTLGVPLFQEQVLRMAMDIADFTGSEAEELRRAMSFKRSPERMHAVMDKLRAAMTKKEVPRHTQERVVASIQSFALYGFPESHAISFALLTYASCWLKTHRPAEFYTGLLNQQPMGFYSPATLLKDAKRHGIRALPPCVNQSQEITTVVDDHCLRLGLQQIKGLNQKTLQKIVQHQPYPDLTRLLQTVPLDKRQRRLLALSGALASLTDHRRAALWDVEPSAAPDLFNRETQEVKTQDTRPEALSALDPFERLTADYATLGLTTGKHPMAYIRDQNRHLTTAADLPKLKHHTPVVIGGQVICRQRPGTAKGHVFISLEDETGISNAFVPAPTFEHYRAIITQERFLQLKGRTQTKDNVTTLFTEEVERLPFHPEIEVASHDFH